MENFVEIIGYEGYVINKEGTVKRLAHETINCKGSIIHRKEKVIKPYVDNSGHIVVKLNGVNKPVHRLIFENFIDSDVKGYEIHHIDFNKFNNSLDNLIKLTRKEHVLIHNSQGQLKKLTQEKIDKIYALAAEGLNITHIAKQVGCSRCSVRNYLQKPLTK